MNTRRTRPARTAFDRKYYVELNRRIMRQIYQPSPAIPAGIQAIFIPKRYDAEVETLASTNAVPEFDELSDS